MSLIVCKLMNNLCNGVDGPVGAALPLVDEEGEERHERRIHHADPQAQSKVRQDQVPHVEGGLECQKSIINLELF